MTTLLLADDHQLFVQALAHRLEGVSDFQVIARAGDGRQTLDLCEQQKPNIAIVDFTMPFGGVPLIASLTRLSEPPRVLVLTMHRNVDYCREALAAGAAGYATKLGTLDDLLLALRAVARGDIYVEPSLTRGLLPESTPAAQQIDPWDRLSARQQQVLSRVALGHNNREIAEVLGLSVKTVETHRARAMDGLALKSRAELVKFLVRRGLLGIVEQ